ncbi:MAG TPA: phosphoenolpyruvate carboxylase, partial [Candidatus Dormibacteraeota bacterium]
MSSPVGILLQTLRRVVDRAGADGSADPVALDVRTASTALHLTNLGELVEQSRRLSRTGGAVEELRSGDPARFAGVVAQPVLTAHPTEARRMAVRRRLEQVRAALEPVLGEAPPPGAGAALEVAVEMLWRTDSVRHTTVTVHDEIRSAQTYLSGPLAEAATTVENLAQPGAPAGAPSRLRLGSWIGGDQDGNPFCTAADLQEALRGAQEIARSRHRELALRARDELTLPLHVDDLEPRTRRWLRIHAGERAGHRFVGEALRLLAEVVAERVGTASPTTYRSRGDLAADIERIAGEMQRTGSGHLVEPLLGRWRAWCRLAGLHLIDLDVRTHRDVLRSLAVTATPRAELLWGDPRALLAELSAAGPPAADSGAGDQLLDSLVVWADFLRRNPDLGGSMVLSTTGGPAEIVVALWLLRSHPPLDERIRISPLFEEEQALAECGETLRAVLALPEY